MKILNEHGDISLFITEMVMYIVYRVSVCAKSCNECTSSSSIIVGYVLCWNKYR
jgi:hypothetical protein